MGEKATRDHTPKQPPLDDDLRWWSIEAAHKWLTERFSDTALATIELMKALAEGRVHCMARSRRSGEPRPVAPAEWIDQIELLFWKNRPRVFSRHPSMRMIARRPTRVREQVRDWVFYVWQPDLDRIWPAKPTKSATVKDKPASERKAKPESRPKKERKSYWDDAIDRVLRENHLDTNVKPKDVVDKVLEALGPEIKKSGRKPPTRGLILRRSGHWKS